MSEIKSFGLILAIVACALLLEFKACGLLAEGESGLPDTILVENDRQLDSLRKFSDSMKAAPPDTVRVKVVRYIRKHDTMWASDTIQDTVHRLTEVTRWLMLSDSTCRQKLDSVTRTDSLHIMQRDGTDVALRSTRDSLRSEEKALHWKDVAVGGTGTILLLSLAAGFIFFSP